MRGERETHKLALSRSEPSIVPYDTSIARRRLAKRIIFHPYSFAHHPSISHPFAKHALPPSPHNSVICLSGRTDGRWVEASSLNPSLPKLRARVRRLLFVRVRSPCSLATEFAPVLADSGEGRPDRPCLPKLRYRNRPRVYNLRRRPSVRLQSVHKDSGPGLASRGGAAGPISQLITPSSPTSMTRSLTLFKDLSTDGPRPGLLNGRLSDWTGVCQARFDYHTHGVTTNNVGLS